jgi:hypothetical protein
MNRNVVFSLPSAVAVTDALPEGILPFRRAKVTATGVDYAGAADADIGTTVPGDLNREEAAIHSRGVGLQSLEVSTATAIAVGDQLEGVANGMVKKFSAGTASYIATEACAEVGAVIRCVAI